MALTLKESLAKAAAEKAAAQTTVDHAAVPMTLATEPAMMSILPEMAAYSGDDGSWMQHTKYQHYSDYSDDNISTIDDQKNIALNNKQTNINQEENSQLIPFEMNRYYDGFDLTNTTIVIHYETSDGYHAEATPINVTYNNSKIRFGWLVDAHVTHIAGSVKFEIRAYGVNSQGNAYLWKSRTATDLTVLQSLCSKCDKVIELDDSWIQEIVGLVTQTITGSSVTSLSAELNSIKGDVSTNKSDVATLGNKVATLETTIDGIDTSPRKTYDATYDEEFKWTLWEIENEGMEGEKREPKRQFTIQGDAGGGTIGKNGASAYEIAVKNGFEGSEQEWLESLQGERGASILHVEDSVTYRREEYPNGYSKSWFEMPVQTIKSQAGVNEVLVGDTILPKPQLGRLYIVTEISGTNAILKEGSSIMGSKGDDYVLTDSDKQEIAEQAAQLADCNIKPITKTEPMTQPVGMDSEGKLWVEPVGNGSGTSQAVNYDLNVKAVNHRGYSTGAPENTIPAYIMSKQKGFTYVECDVSFTSDGVAVLLHDATIDRTSNGSGNISNMTYEQVLQYDFGSWLSSEYEGVKIPTFTEFIILCKRLGLHPYIELKSNGSYTQAQITQIVKEVEKCGMTGKVTYISFNNTYLGYVKNADSNARLGLLANPLNSTKISQAVALKTGTNEVFMDAKLSTVTDSLINSCISNGLPLEVWTINTEGEIISMPSYVSGVTSDNLIAGEILYEAALTYVPPVSTYVPATGITLDKTALEFDSFDETMTLTATVEPSNASDKVVWKSSNAGIASVNGGVVTPVANGSCAITATAGNYSATCNIVVDVTMHSITRNLVGCKTSSTIEIIEENKSHTETITALTGYKMDGAVVDITMGGVSIPSAYSDGALTIDAVTGDIVIIVEAVEIPTYNITRNLIGCASTNNETAVNEGGTLTETITALDGYVMMGADVTITMGGADISNSYNSETQTITIAEATGDIVITVTAVKTHTITRTLVGCVSSSTVSSIINGEPHTETISAMSNWTLDDAEVAITMGGVDASHRFVDGVLSIDAVTGDIVINITAAAEPFKPVVDLALTNVTDGVLHNVGTGGNAYDATIAFPKTGDNYTSDENGLTLLNHAYANVPYGFKASDKFTIAVRGSLKLGTNTYQRLMRAETDAPSLFYSYTAGNGMGAKLAGVTRNGMTIHASNFTDNTAGSPLNTVYIKPEHFDATQTHTYIFTNDGTTIKYYVDGVYAASQNATSLKSSTKIGLGDNDASKTYCASETNVEMFRIYNYTMSAEEVASIGSGGGGDTNDETTSELDKAILDTMILE